MFGKRSAREQVIYEQLLQKAEKHLHHAERSPEIRQSAAREAREMIRQEQQAQATQARQAQHEHITQGLFQDAEKRQKIQASAHKHLKAIAKGLHHDGMEPDADLMQRLVESATEEYVSGGGSDPTQFKEVFETEYQETLKTKTFYNPYTGEIEAW